jgi:hypothetical protein
MKFYFTISVLVQLLLAFLSGDKNKVSYMLYLWGSLFDRDIFRTKSKTNSDSIFHPGKSKSKTIGDKYSFLLEG